MAYTLVMQNTATRAEYVVEGLVNISPSPLYYEFKRYRMPAGAPEGEYRCALIWDGRDDTVYVPADDLLDTVVETGDGNVKLKDLRPEVFLMRYGLPEDAGVALEKDTKYVYRKK